MKKPEMKKPEMKKPAVKKPKRKESAMTKPVAKKPAMKKSESDAKGKVAASDPKSATPRTRTKRLGKNWRHRNQVAKSGDVAANRAPAIKKKPAVGKSKKVVVAKPPMEEVKPQGLTQNSNSSLSGKWKVIEAIHEGKTMSAESLGQMSLEFSNNSLAIRQGEKIELGTVVAGGQRSFGKLTVNDIEIKSTRKNVPSIKGFYFLQGEELNMIWSAPGGELPNSMDADELIHSRVLKLVQ